MRGKVYLPIVLWGLGHILGIGVGTRPAHAASPATQEPPQKKPAPSSDDYETTVHSKRKSAQARIDRKNPGFATALVIDTWKQSEGPTAAVDAIAQSPGIHARSAGSGSDFTALSLRGADSGQTRFLLDGVPLGDTTFGLSLGDISPWTLAQIEIYRGHVPVDLGAEAIGGVIHLVTNNPKDADSQTRSRLMAGAGSFGTFNSGVETSQKLSTTAFSLRAELSGSQGNFPFFSDGRTPQTPEDDAFFERQNNDHRKAVVHASLRGGKSQGLRYRVSQFAYASERGIAGSWQVPGHARLEKVGAVTIANLRHAFPGLHGGQTTWRIGAGADRRVYLNPQTLGQPEIFQTQVSPHLYVSPVLTWPLAQSLKAKLLLSGRYQGNFQKVRQDGVDENRHRFVMAAGASVHWRPWADKVHISPGLRVDGVASYFQVLDDGDPIPDHGANRFLLEYTPRLAARIRLWRQGLSHVSLRGSLGRYFRLPTLLELFGSQGFLLGNAGLSPEVGQHVDAGPHLALKNKTITFELRSAAFCRRSENLIQWAAAGPSAMRPFNIEAANLWGHEHSLTAALKIDRVKYSLEGAYTYLATENLSPRQAQHGKSLPGRPRHDGSATLAMTLPHSDPQKNIQLYYGIEGLAGMPLDSAERLISPTRIYHQAGARLTWGPWFLLLRIQNLFDRTMVRQEAPGASTPLPTPHRDYIDYPLPGRALWLSLTYAPNNTENQPKEIL